MPVPLTADQRQVMQAVYDHFRKNGSWPTLAAIARPLRRDHNIDAAGVIAEFPETLMIPPRQGLRPVDSDQIRPPWRASGNAREARTTTNGSRG